MVSKTCKMVNKKCLFNFIFTMGLFILISCSQNLDEKQETVQSKEKNLDMEQDPKMVDFKDRLKEIAAQKHIELDLNDKEAVLNLWFEDMFNDKVDKSPMFQTYLGMKTNYDKWDDVSQKAMADEFAIAKSNYHIAKSLVGAKGVTDQTNDYANGLIFNLRREINLYPLRKYNYVFTQFYGPHSSIPSFLINYHRVDNIDDAKAYIARIGKAGSYLRANMENASWAAQQGIVPPRWVFPQMRETAANVVLGYPFIGKGDNIIYADFVKKISKLDLSKDVVVNLKEEAKQALLKSLQPAYLDLINMFNEQEVLAPDFDGVGGFAGGDKYYLERLVLMTSTNIDADTVHKIGLKNVERIHGEMKKIKEKIGFKGTLPEFFVYMRKDPDGKFTYPNTDEGRKKYLVQAKTIVADMRSKLDDYFGVKPKAKIIVKRVEKFRERSAGKAFYNRPDQKGTRPGIFYLNLYNMQDMPIYQMEALAFHEGIPGHHMQIAIGQELENVPTFVKFASNTAFIEGWGLYSEYLPKEMGFYQDPYSDFGRLAMELWRAARLVVDTGIHAKAWSREKAIDYLVTNTPNPIGDCVKAIERYIVMPGQATAYMIGKIKILEMRQYARDELGDKFDIKEFHDVVLGQGSRPLKVFETSIKRWVEEVKQRDDE